MSQLINIFLEPAKVFAELREKPTFLVPALALGVNCWDGACTYPAVAEGVGAEYTPLDRVLGG